MNMQAMLKQAQSLQKNMMKTQEEIWNKDYEGKSSFVSVIISGKRKVKSVKIDTNEVDFSDVELLEDMVLLAVNDALSKIDQETEEKMGKYTQGMPGLF